MRFLRGCAGCWRGRPASPVRAANAYASARASSVVRLEPSGDMFANPDPEELMRLATGKGGD